MDVKRLRRTMLGTLVVCLACGASVTRIFGHTDLRMVDAVTLVGFGVTLGAYIFNTVLYFRVKKQAQQL